MGEWKEGKLKSSSGDPVKYPSGRKQAIAIALSESGQSNPNRERGGETAKGKKRLEKKIKMEKGGNLGGVDLFEDYENIPAKVQKVLDKYEKGFVDGDYDILGKAKEALEKIGYTFEYYLDGIAYDLRKIGDIGKVEAAEKNGSMAIGGQLPEKINEAQHQLRYANASAEIAKDYIENTSNKEKAIQEMDESKERIKSAIDTLNNNEMAHGGEINNIKEEITILKESIGSQATDESSRVAMNNRLKELEKLLEVVAEKEKAQRNVTVPANSFWVAIDQKYSNPMRNHLNTNNIKFTSRMVNRKYTVYVDSQEDLDKVVSIYNLKRVKGKDKPVSTSEVSGKSEKGGKLWEGNAKKKEEVLRNKAKRMGLGDSLSEDTLNKIEIKGPNWKKRVDIVRARKGFK